MLWVRLPPELLTRNTSSRSSLECSPPCHGGDRRFKSDRGRFDSAVRKQAKRRSSNLRGLWVRLPPVLLPLVTDAGGPAREQSLISSARRVQPPDPQLKNDRVRKPAKRRGREPRACGFDSHPGHSDPVVQRRRRLADIQESAGSIPAGITRTTWSVSVLNLHSERVSMKMASW